MARYADIDGLLAYLNIASAKEQGDLPRDFYGGVGFACYEIENFQLSDVAPVVHAHWTEEDDGWGDSYWVCSNCKEPWWLEEGTPEDNNMFYCPHCGARMDEEVENG